MTKVVDGGPVDTTLPDGSHSPAPPPGGNQTPTPSGGSGFPYAFVGVIVGLVIVAILYHSCHG